MLCGYKEFTGQTLNQLTTPTNTLVCSRHFIEGKLKHLTFTMGKIILVLLSLGKPSSLYEETNPHWAPSLFLGGAPEPTASAPSRYERVVERREKRKRLDACHTLLQLSQHCSTSSYVRGFLYLLLASYVFYEEYEKTFFAMVRPKNTQCSFSTGTRSGGREIGTRDGADISILSNRYAVKRH